VRGIVDGAMGHPVHSLLAQQLDGRVEQRLAPVHHEVILPQ
jgi:hypothetical protein